MAGLDFSVPDISDPVIDRSTGMMTESWYRVFELFEQIVSSTSDNLVTTVVTVTGHTGQIAGIEASSITGGGFLDGGGPLSGAPIVITLDTAALYADAGFIAAIRAIIHGYLVAGTAITLTPGVGTLTISTP